jgi:hypothetical protein
MKKFSQKLYPTVREETFFAPCGVADLIATCYGGRNRLVAMEYTRLRMVRRIIPALFSWTSSHPCVSQQYALVRSNCSTCYVSVSATLTRTAAGLLSQCTSRSLASVYVHPATRDVLLLLPLLLLLCTGW